MPQFTALNGLEYKKVIMNRISEELDNSGLFVQNLTYPWIKWGFVFKHTSYPARPMEEAPQPLVEVSQESSPLDPGAPPESRTVAVVDHEAVIDTPDQARVDSAQPIPTPVPLVGIGIVDKPIMQAPAASKNKTHEK